MSDTAEKPCEWCGHPTPNKWCSKRCRQTAWRARKLAVAEGLDGQPRRLGVADPPYPGKAWMYRDQPTFAGEVDHARLLDQLATFDGWVLSTSQEALPAILRLLPESTVVEVCPWVKTHHHTRARGLSNVHEYVIVSPARQLFPGVRDTLVAKVACGGDSKLIGRKPLKWWMWVFALLGAQPGDSLDDMFPGTGMGDRAWRQFCRAGTTATSTGSMGDIEE